MNGKVLKISSNDLYGNVDERKIVLFAAFIHKKYMNKYAIFTFEEEYNKKKLLLASIHLKENSIVTFMIRDNEIEYINDFIDDYLAQKVDTSKYELIDISNINKIELVSYTPIDFDKLNELDKLSIKRIESNEIVDDKKKSHGFLYFIIFIILLLAGGTTYLYFNPDALDAKLKKLECTQTSYNRTVELKYTSEAELKFNKKDELSSYHKIDTYIFDNEEDYLEFKDNNNESKYFNVEGAYKYDDDKLELKLIYDEDIVIYDYEEVSKYLKSIGYTCVEGIYNEQFKYDYWRR